MPMLQFTISYNRHERHKEDTMDKYIVALIYYRNDVLLYIING